MDELKRKLEDIFVKPKPTELEVKVETILTSIPEIESSIKLLDEKVNSIEIPEAINGDKGDKGDKGDSYILTEKDKKEIAKSVKVPVVEKVVETVIEKPVIIDKTITEIKEVAIPQTGEQIVDKINELSLDPENQIDAKHIKNLPNLKQFVGGSLARNLDQLGDVSISSVTNNQVLKYNSTTNRWENGAGGGGSGTVTSVDMTVPAGLIVTGNPVTTAGTLAVALDTGYVIPLQSTLDGFVPYTGATTDVDLGGNRIKLSGADFRDGQGFDFYSDNLITFLGGIAFTSADNLGISNSAGTRYANIDVSQITTSDKTFTLPNTTGTIALTSDITGTNSGTNTGDQTITNTSDATSHTVTLSASGGSVQLIEGTNITLTTGGTGSAGIVTISSTGSGGIARSINSISTPTTAGATASTDYVYFVSGTTTLTLPTAVGNTNMYTVKNTGVATVTVDTTSAQTIDGASTLTINTPYSYNIISNGSNWFIV